VSPSPAGAADGQRSRRGWGVVTVRRVVAGAAAAAAAGAAGYAANRLFRRRAVERGLRSLAHPLPQGPTDAKRPAQGDELELPGDVVHHYVDVRDGGRVHVVERGNGPEIVLLHGAGLSAGVWAYQFRDLTDRFRLVALDLRGHGESRPGSDGMTIKAMVDDLVHVLMSLDLRPALLVGHSLGGMTVLRFARQYPQLVAERVASVMLLSTAAGVVPNVAPWNRLGTLAGRAAVAAGGVVARSGRAGLPEGEIGRAFCRAGFGVAPSAPQINAVLRMMRAADPGLLAGLVPELMAFDERAAFEEMSIPVTVVVGDRDRVTRPALARQLAETLGGAHVVVWPGGGHMLMYERREALDWLIKRLASAPEAAMSGSKGAGRGR